MRDKRAAKCFKFYNNNLVLVIICFSGFCFARFGRFSGFGGFGGFVSLFRVLVHACLRFITTKSTSLVILIIIIEIYLLCVILWNPVPCLMSLMIKRVTVLLKEMPIFVSTSSILSVLFSVMHILRRWHISLFQAFS